MMTYLFYGILGLAIILIVPALAFFGSLLGDEVDSIVLKEKKKERERYDALKKKEWQIRNDWDR